MEIEAINANYIPPAPSETEQPVSEEAMNENIEQAAAENNVGENIDIIA